MSVALPSRRARAWRVALIDCMRGAARTVSGLGSSTGYFSPVDMAGFQAPVQCWPDFLLAASPRAHTRCFPAGPRRPTSLGTRPLGGHRACTKPSVEQLSQHKGAHPRAFRRRSVLRCYRTFQLPPGEWGCFGRLDLPRVSLFSGVLASVQTCLYSKVWTSKQPAYPHTKSRSASYYSPLAMCPRANLLATNLVAQALGRLPWQHWAALAVN